jgi:hypothetical protein
MREPEGMIEPSPSPKPAPTVSAPAPAPVIHAAGVDDLSVLDDWVPPPEDFEFEEPIPLPPVPKAMIEPVGENHEEPPPPAPLPSLNLSAGIAIPSKNDSGNGGNGGKPAGAGSPRGNGGVHPAHAGEVVPTYAARGSGRLVRVHIHRSHDSDEDIRRMRELLKVFRSAEGRDRFSLTVPHGDGHVLLDFPNFSTNYEVLAAQLAEMVAEWGQLEVE